MLSRWLASAHKRVNARPPSHPEWVDAETCYFFHKLSENCLVAALIITKYVKPAKAKARASIDRFMIGWGFGWLLIMCLCSFIILLILFPPRLRRLSHDLSRNAFLYGCAQVTTGPDRPSGYLWSPHGLITRAMEEKPTATRRRRFGVVYDFQADLRATFRKSPAFCQKQEDFCNPKLTDL